MRSCWCYINGSPPHSFLASTSAPPYHLPLTTSFNPTTSGNSRTLTSDSTMGGCASKPKELVNGTVGSPNSDNPQPQTTAQNNTNGGESQIEKPEPEAKKEAQTSSSEVVSAETDVPKEEDVKATDENKEDTAEATTKEPEKEVEAAEHKPNDAPPSKEEVKGDAPLVAL
ncbi:hypothetical protein V6N13_108902 [Hibiscus sabdariffa]|uniref:Uncharacterized protein n=2 Tax=Hibiscus sabdariffa TaxID=183260 RepID=A0ABR2FN93_9ROSI